MEATILEFHLEYNPNRRNPAEVFLAMGNFISAYQEMGKVIARAIESEGDFDVELQEVTHGCILAKLAFKKLEEWTRPDSVFNDFTGEVSKREQIHQIANNESARLQEETEKRGSSKKIEPYISDLDVALVAERWSDGNKLLMPNESLKVCKSGAVLSNVKPFDQSFRFTGKIKEMFSENHGHFDGIEILEVFKPCKKATSKWEVISTKTGSKFKAEILHKQWLDNYLKSEVRLGGSDYLKAKVEYDVVNENGQESIRNARIKEIIEVMTYHGTQNEIFTE